MYGLRNEVFSFCHHQRVIEIRHCQNKTENNFSFTVNKILLGDIISIPANSHAPTENVGFKNMSSLNKINKIAHSLYDYRLSIKPFQLPQASKKLEERMN